MLSDMQLGCFGTESKPNVHMSHKAIISDPHSQCTCWIICITLQGIILWQNIPLQDISISTAMTLPSAMSGFSTCRGTLGLASGSSVPPCCSLGVGHPLTSLGFLALGRQQSSINDGNYYHHCNNYSSGGKLQCQLTMVKSLPNQLVGKSLVCL